MGSWSRALVGVCAAAVIVGVLVVRVTNASAAVAQVCDRSGYKLSLQSLTGPPRTDLIIRVSAKAAGCELPDTLIRVQVAVLPFKKLPARKVILSNVLAPGGTATLDLGRVQRLRLVRATVSFGSQVVLAAQTKTRLKPDLVLARAYAGRSAVIGRPFFVVAIVRNRTKDVGLGALVSVTSGGAPLATKQLKVGPRGRVVLQIPVTLTQLGTTQLTVTVTPASPIETTLKNNTRGLAVEATEFKVQESATLAQSFAGYGGQFNHHVYAAISRAAGVTDDNAKDMERKMRELQPQFSRVFFNNTAFTDPDRMQSFVRTVQLAQLTQEHGALVLRFTADDVECEGSSLYPARSREDNLALPFHRDGIRTLTFSPGTTARETKKGASRFDVITARHCSSVKSGSGARRLTAALLTTMSSTPILRSMSATASLTASETLTSNGMVCATSPSAASVRFAVSSRSALRPLMITSAPARASPDAIASPRPLPPPVTSARRPERSNGCAAEVVSPPCSRE